jgi:hypothetical protein
MHFFPSFYPNASLLAIVFSDFSESGFSGLPISFWSFVAVDCCFYVSLPAFLLVFRPKSSPFRVELINGGIIIVLNSKISFSNTAVCKIEL